MRKNTCKLLFSFILFLSLWIVFVDLQMVRAKKTTTIPSVRIGVIVDFDDWMGKMVLSCINLALSDFHAHSKTKFVVYAKDSKRNTVFAASAAMDMIKDKEVEAILIGSAETSADANSIIQLGEKAQVPIISFFLTAPKNQISSPYFFQATRTNPNNLVNATSAIVKLFGWREAVAIYIDNEYGVEIIPYLTNAFQTLNIQIPHWTSISPSATDDQILEKLSELKRMQIRVFIVHLLPHLGSQLFTIAKEIGMMSKEYVWILTDGMTNFLDSMDPSVIDSMQGALGIRPYLPETERLKSFRVQWKMKFHQDHAEMVNASLNIYGLWAYDATISLAKAFETLIGTSRNARNLVQALSNTRFKGLTGDFHFVRRQLQSSAFQVVNIVDSDGAIARGVGFWTAKKGLVQRLNNSTGKISAGLKDIIWPEFSTSNPKGWEIPTNGTRLLVGVPDKEGFKEFVNVSRSPFNVNGYCIELFETVRKSLPYALEVQYIPFPDIDYNELVHQVEIGNFDAVVGDITIIANRSMNLDFTLPYMNTGVLMILPEQDSNSDPWAFMKPLTWKLWATTLCFFIFLGLVVWVLEHRINEEFQGSPSSQIGTSFWFSFSTMVFAHREKLVSNLARCVVIIWCFVGLILTQSYSASLSSYLTVKQLQPIIDLNYLMRHKVGYQDGSFVGEILQNLGFEKSNLIDYNSAEECQQLFSNGSIVAAFDESPYVNLISTQSCRKYSVVDPFKLTTSHWKNLSNIQELKTDGLGFVFPKGSPLVADISRGILRVTQGQEIKRIEENWFGVTNIDSNCSSDSQPPNRLDLSHFWGLFLIAGTAAFLALTIYTVMFVYEYRDSIRSRIVNLSRIFDQNDNQSGLLDTDAATDSPGEQTESSQSEHPDDPNLNIDLTSSANQERPTPIEIIHQSI